MTRSASCRSQRPTPDSADDKWYQAALTIEGKIGNFDVVYTGAHLKRDVDQRQDYSDYGYWYNEYFVNYNTYNDPGAFDPAAYGAEYSCYLFFDTANSGYCGNPDQFIRAKDRYKKTSHELRIQTPTDYPVHAVIGGFWQSQRHGIEQRYMIDNIPASREVTGWPDTVWLTQQVRTDKDKAIFTEVTWDMTEQLSATVGRRWFKTDNALKGFFAYGLEFPFSGGGGERNCIDNEPFHGAPCTVFDKSTDEKDNISKANIKYQITDDHMVYATWAEGFRPGGINRRGTLPPYTSDFLESVEIGWKTSWLDNRVTFNGAVFEEKWKDFQFAVLGPSGLTEIRNAAQAKIKGAEGEFNIAATENLTLSAGIAIYDPKLSENYCGTTLADGSPETDCASPEAPKGTRLPVVSKLKTNLSARYNFTVAGWDAYAQATAVYEGSRQSDMRLLQRDILGKMDSYWLTDINLGVERENYSLEFYVRNITDERAEMYRFVQCLETICGRQDYTAGGGPLLEGDRYTGRNQPRTFGLRWAQRF